jgi:hypothetical protein
VGRGLDDRRQAQPGVDRGAGADAEVGLKQLWHAARERARDRLGDPGSRGRAADEQDLVEVGRAHLHLVERPLAAGDRAVEERRDQLGELGARDPLVGLDIAPGGIDEQAADAKLDRGPVVRGPGQVDLHLLGLPQQLRQPAARSGVGLIEHRRPAALLDALAQPVDELAIDVVAAEQRIAVERAHLDHPLVALEVGDVERAAAEIVGQDPQRIARIAARVGERRCDRLHQHLLGQRHVEAGLARCFAGLLDLGAVEVRRVGDDRAPDRLAERTLGAALEVAQELAGDVPGEQVPAAQRDLLARADLALGEHDRGAPVVHRLQRIRCT